MRMRMRLRLCGAELAESTVMVSMLFVVWLFLYAASGSVQADTSTTADLLWPLPRVAMFGSNVYSLEQVNFDITSTGPGGDADLLKGALVEYLKLIFETPAPFFPSGGQSGGTSGSLPSLVVDVKSEDQTLGLQTDESYFLSVTGGKGMLEANTVFGALKGLETFSQLVFRAADGSYAINEVTNVTDHPRFQYRGVMIDTSRHYLSVPIIFANLDAMAYNKFNVLHWHIVDDQSFPYDSINFPNITKMGAYDHRHVYTQDDIAAIIQYARNKGIRVIPEFDSPGHSQSWGIGQPGLLTECYSGGKPTGSYGPINPTLQSTWDFLEVFFKEMADVFPDRYLHLGGDEVSFACWESNPQIQKWMTEHNYTDYSQLEQYYETNLLDLVEKLGKQYVVWQEIFDNGLKVLPDTVIDVWKSGWQAEMAKVTAKGLKTILSACWYLNYISYGSDWHSYYGCDPQNFNGTAEENSLVVGGHACLWAEYVDSTNFMSRLWPRAGSVGERLWSDKSVTDLNSASTRLHNMQCRLISRGIRAQPPDGPSFCSYEWPA